MASAENNQTGAVNAAFATQILRKIFLEDWLTKLLALAITLALWVGVTGLSEVGSDRYKVSLKLRLAENAEATNQPVDQVEIRISGDKRRLEQIRNEDLQVLVDLTSKPVGNHTVTLAPDTVTVTGLPNGVRLEDISPNKVVLRLETIESKNVPVRVETQGSVSRGSEIYSESVVPGTVVVRGPASYLRSLTSLPTEKINISDKNSDFNASQVRLAPLSNEGATLSQSFVDVSFRIGETRIEKSFTIPITDSKRRVQFTLFGGTSLFEGVSAKDFSASLVEGSGDPQIVLPGKLNGVVEVRRIKLL